MRYFSLADKTSSLSTGNVCLILTEFHVFESQRSFTVLAIRTKDFVPP